MEGAPALRTLSSPRQAWVERVQAVALALATLVPAAILTSAAVTGFLRGHAGIDLAIFDQALWNASREGLPHSSLIGDSILGDHFSPGVLAFIPLYRLWPSALWLLVAQGVALWAAVHQLVGRLRPALGSWRSALVGQALLLSPLTAYALLFDWHPVTIAVPFALASIWALEDGRPSKALVMGLAAAAFRLEVGLAVVVALAVLRGGLRFRQRLHALVPLGLYVAVAGLFDALLGKADYWAAHYGHLGASPAGALGNPAAAIGHLLSASTLEIAFFWLLGGGLVAVAKPRLALPAAVVALPLLLSAWPGTRTLVHHYWVAPALLLAVAWVPLVKGRRILATVVIVANLALAAMYGPFVPALEEPLSGLGWKESKVSELLGADAEVACLIRGIPPGASVSASDRPATLLAHREPLYPWPYPFRAPIPKTPGAASLDEPAPDLPGEIDYLVVPLDAQAAVPEEFVLDAWGRTHARFARGNDPTEPRLCP